MSTLFSEALRPNVSVAFGMILERTRCFVLLFLRIVAGELRWGTRNVEKMKEKD
jgi:hypothetical protein